MVKKVIAKSKVTKNVKKSTVGAKKKVAKKVQAKSAKRAVQKVAAKTKTVAKTKTSAKKTSIKKVAAKKNTAVVKKVISKNAPRVASVKAKKSTKQSVSWNERWHLIAQTAYLKAEQRGFVNGSEYTDWLSAETEVDSSIEVNA